MTTPLERFWSKVDKENGPVHPVHGRCWMWTAGAFDNGYGAFTFDGKLRKAHRVSWALENGAIPAGLLVLHRCDTPRCQRPDHLFLGTPADNMQDKVAKGRQAHVRGHHKLTEDQVVKIKRILAGPRMTNRAIAAQFGVTDGAIAMIRRGLTWKGAA